jgi:hypothetical protein
VSPANFKLSNSAISPRDYICLQCSLFILYVIVLASIIVYVRTTLASHSLSPQLVPLSTRILIPRRVTLYTSNQPKLCIYRKRSPRCDDCHLVESSGASTHRQNRSHIMLAEPKAGGEIRIGWLVAVKVNDTFAPASALAKRISRRNHWLENSAGFRSTDLGHRSRHRFPASNSLMVKGNNSAVTWLWKSMSLELWS